MRSGVIARALSAAVCVVRFRRAPPLITSSSPASAASPTTSSASPPHANDLDRIFKSEGPSAHVTTLTGAQATAAQLKSALASVARDAKADDDFVLILIGHGSFDGVEYKFNLVGPDMTATEIAALCDRIPARRQLIVDTTSASGGAMPALERPGRAVIAATKSGTEKNATVFARYWVEALQDPVCRHRQERFDQRNGSLYLRDEKDRGVLRLAEAPGHRARSLQRHGHRRAGARSRQRPRPTARRASRCCGWARASRLRTILHARACSSRRIDLSRRSTR